MDRSSSDSEGSREGQLRSIASVGCLVDHPYLLYLKSAAALVVVGEGAIGLWQVSRASTSYVLEMEMTQLVLHSGPCCHSSSEFAAQSGKASSSQNSMTS